VVSQYLPTAEAGRFTERATTFFPGLFSASAELLCNCCARRTPHLLHRNAELAQNAQKRATSTETRTCTETRILHRNAQTCTECTETHNLHRNRLLGKNRPTGVVAVDRSKSPRSGQDHAGDMIDRAADGGVLNSKVAPHGGQHLSGDCLLWLEPRTIVTRLPRLPSDRHAMALESRLQPARAGTPTPNCTITRR
jgi:hypothetical protein